MSKEPFNGDALARLQRLRDSYIRGEFREARQEALISASQESKYWVIAAAITLQNRATQLANSYSFDPIPGRDLRTSRNNFLGFFNTINDRFPNPIELSARTGRTWGQQANGRPPEIIIRLRGLADCLEIVRSSPDLATQRNTAASIYRELIAIYDPQTEPFVPILEPFSSRNPMPNGFDIRVKPQLVARDPIWRYFLRGVMPPSL